MKNSYILLFASLLLVSCGGAKKCSADGSSVTASAEKPVGPAFSADSAWLFCEKQCQFGPRTMNSDAHERCAEWIAEKFRDYGMAVSLQKTTLRGYDGTPLKCTNIIAAYQPELSDRILLCAHWDSRPWADNDPNPDNWRKPVMAANDGASGVAVMLELARLLSPHASHPTSLTSVGIDFVCFDAEDWGTPQWAETDGDDSDTWALGAQHWADSYAQRATAADGDTLSTAVPNYRFGILFDMVGGMGSRFFQEGVSLLYAPQVVQRVWKAAEAVGFGSYFPKKQGGSITDDHLPVNRKAGIPCIDIIPYYPDCEQSSFGPTWHTVNDDMEHIDKNTLLAVGQTIVQVLFSLNK